jgi:hypothetical protein
MSKCEHAFDDFAYLLPTSVLDCDFDRKFPQTTPYVSSFGTSKSEGEGGGGGGVVERPQRLHQNLIATNLVLKAFVVAERHLYFVEILLWHHPLDEQVDLQMTNVVLVIHQ